MAPSRLGVVSQFQFSPERDEIVSHADVAPENVIAGAARCGRQRRSFFILNPTTGTLEARPDAGVKIEKALLRELRRIKRCVYLSLASLYFAKFRLQCRCCAVHISGYICGLLR